MRRLLIACAVLFCVSMGAAGWALYDRFEQTNARRDAQAEFNRIVAQVALDNCRDIEKLKASRRQEAIDTYRELERNLALLGLPNTPQVREQAKRSRDRKLGRFKREPCPRPPLQEGS